MKRIQRTIALALCIAIAAPAFAGIGSGTAAYRGGTLPAKDGSEGRLELTDRTNAVYRTGKQRYEIPYTGVTSIEYGQKAGRRVGAAIATAVLVSPLGLALLLSKKRKHMVTIAWTVDGKGESAVFELGKDAIRPALAALEARTGKQVEYESEDARKNVGR